MDITLKKCSCQRLICVFVFVIAVLTPLSARADLYSGSLTVSGGGITAAGKWNDDGTSIDWSVTPNGSGYWTYSYTFNVPEKGLSHLIIQVSDGTEGDLDAFLLSEPDFVNTQNYDIDGIGPDDVLLDTYDKDSQGGSNPGMPAGSSIYGLKFESELFPEPPSTPYSWTVEFDSYRNPTWGDFYAKNGADVYAYNTGLEVEPDVELNHIAVPDTSYVPVPGAVLLGVLGLGAAAMKLRRFA